MPSEVRQQLDAGQIYPVVRMTGVLDATSAPSVRASLLDLVAGQPEAVVVDVHGLTVGDPAATAVVREVARDVADWPGCHLLLCAGPHTSVWRDTGLPVWPSPGEAFAALGAPQPQRFRRTPLEPVAGAARRSRELVTEACARWDLADLVGPACIVVTEMVNNVVAHAQTPMTVLFAVRGIRMSVAVRDHSPDVPRFTGSPVPVTSFGGRGLLLIDSVAQRWGSLVLDDGKVVWAVLTAGEDLGRQMPGTGMAGQTRG